MSISGGVAGVSVAKEGAVGVSSWAVVVELASLGVVERICHEPVMEGRRVVVLMDVVAVPSVEVAGGEKELVQSAKMLDEAAGSRDIVIRLTVLVVGSAASKDVSVESSSRPESDTLNLPE